MTRTCNLRVAVSKKITRTYNQSGCSYTGYLTILCDFHNITTTLRRYIEDLR
jgi:hypothetical protein